jgi:hypothetical protein
MQLEDITVSRLTTSDIAICGVMREQRIFRSLPLQESSPVLRSYSTSAIRSGLPRIFRLRESGITGGWAFPVPSCEARCTLGESGDSKSFMPEECGHVD